MKRVLFAAASAALILTFLIGARLYRKQRAERLDFMARENAELFVRPHSPVLGAPEAKVYLVEFTDPACETCAAFSPYLKRLMQSYEGKLKLVVRYAPFHEGADEVVRILEAARMQGKYWETFDLLYKTQNSWTHHHKVIASEIWQFLPYAGLDVERVKKDMTDPAIDEILRQDLDDAKALGVDKTPGFFVNGKPLEPFGVEPLAILIRTEIQKHYPD